MRRRVKGKPGRVKGKRGALKAAAAARIAKQVATQKAEQAKKRKAARLQRKRRDVAKRFDKGGGLGPPRKAPHAHNSPTSKGAADSLPDEVIAWQERKVFACIRKARVNGMTDEQLELKSGLRHQSASARRRGLVLKGWVKDSGMTRKNRSGRMAITWIVGRDEFALSSKHGSSRPRRPSDIEMTSAMVLIEHNYAISGDADVKTLLAWLRYLAKQSPS